MSSFLLTSFGFGFGACNSVSKAERPSSSTIASDAADPAGTSQSRSTSAGSTTPPRNIHRVDEAMSACKDRKPAAQALASGATADYVVKNTFIDGPLERPLSLEGFFKERETRSCPQSRLASFEDGPLSSRLASCDENSVLLLECIAEIPKEKEDPTDVGHGVSATCETFNSSSRRARPTDAAEQVSAAHDTFDTYDAFEAFPPRPAQVEHVAPAPVPGPGVNGLTFSTHASPVLPAPPSTYAPQFMPAAAPPPPMVPADQSPACVLNLSEVLQQPELGSPELPSLGAIGHHARTCSPCVFFHTAKGCNAGRSCDFCHLCGPDEKKKRKAEKKEMRRAGVTSPTVLGTDALQVPANPYLHAMMTPPPVPVDAPQVPFLGASMPANPGPAPLPPR